MIPSTIRYQPKTLKSCFLMYPIRNLIARMDIPKATNIPTRSTASSVPVKLKPNFKSFKKLAPNITGIARKNVNSAANSLDVPIKIPPIMVEPERDVPGIKERT